jgi:hypothetical protein
MSVNTKDRGLMLGVVGRLLPVICLAGRHFVSIIAVFRLYIQFQPEFTVICPLIVSAFMHTVIWVYQKWELHIRKLLEEVLDEDSEV